MRTARLSSRNPERKAKTGYRSNCGIRFYIHKEYIYFKTEIDPRDKNPKGKQNIFIGQINIGIIQILKNLRE